MTKLATVFGQQGMLCSTHAVSQVGIKNPLYTLSYCYVPGPLPVCTACLHSVLSLSVLQGFQVLPSCGPINDLQSVAANRRHSITHLLLHHPVFLLLFKFLCSPLLGGGFFCCCHFETLMGDVWFMFCIPVYSQCCAVCLNPGGKGDSCRLDAHGLTFYL